MGDGKQLICDAYKVYDANTVQIPLQGHYHPSVTVYASSLVVKTDKALKPDLDSHSLIRFLDKFVYRNAKASDSSKGTSIMQPLRAAKDIGDAWLGSRGPASSASVNSASFWKKKVENVAAEDIFFHQYFQQMSKEEKDARKKTQAAAAGQDPDEDEQEDEVWKALVAAQPGVDPDDEGSDIGFDLDDSDMASDDDDDDEPVLDLDDSDMEDDSDMSVDIEGSDEEMGGAVLSEGKDGFDVKDAEEDKPKSRRKKMKNLPMFASVDDYAELLGGDEDDM